MPIQRPLNTDPNEPILFRTVGEDVYRATLERGSLWLRSGQYYRAIEDQARRDASEGVSSGLTHIPLQIERPDCPPFRLEGPGQTGIDNRPHYIASFHGPSIAPAQHAEFGGWTFGVRNFSLLAAAVYVAASSIRKVDGYRYGPVAYQRSALSILTPPHGGDAIHLPGEPAAALSVINADVFRKAPVHPFIEQDEWRIVIFTRSLLDADGLEPLKVAVDPDQFFAYLEP